MLRLRRGFTLGWCKGIFPPYLKHAVKGWYCWLRTFTYYICICHPIKTHFSWTSRATIIITHPTRGNDYIAIAHILNHWALQIQATTKQKNHKIATKVIKRKEYHKCCCRASFIHRHNIHILLIYIFLIVWKKEEICL